MAFLMAFWNCAVAEWWKPFLWKICYEDYDEHDEQMRVEDEEKEKNLCVDGSLEHTIYIYDLAVPFLEKISNGWN